MCRFNQLLGFSMIAFGLGIWVGLWLESGILSVGFGLLMLGLGFAMCRCRKI